MSEAWKRWNASHPGVHSQRNNKKRDEDKQFVFNLLGNKCIKYGFTDCRALQVDHIHQVPVTIKRTDYKRGGKGLYAAIRRGEFPLIDFQLLCANCN